LESSTFDAYLKLVLKNPSTLYMNLIPSP